MREGLSIVTDTHVDRVDLHFSAEQRGDLPLGLAKPRFGPCRKMQVAFLEGKGASRGKAYTLRLPVIRTVRP